MLKYELKPRSSIRRIEGYEVGRVAKFTIFERVTADAVAGVLPPEYRARAAAAMAPGVEHTVVLFAHDRSDVVTSAPVRKALERVPPGGPVVAVGTNFTAEAAALLAERGSRSVTLGEFYWTDESYQSVRH
jgi:hypothetical protein